jgi:signal transduction histidine kinase
MVLRIKGVALPLAGIALGAAALVLTLARDHAEIRVVGLPREPAFLLLIGWGFVAAALVARRRVEQQRFAHLLAAVGFAWFAAALTASNDALAFTVGLVLAPLWIAFLLHALLAFPTGRLESRLARAAVGAFYVEATVFALAWVLVAKLSESDCAGCPNNVFYIGYHQLAHPILVVQQDVLAVGALLGGVAVCVRRWRGASVALRRALAPVLVSGGLCFALIALIVSAEPLWSGTVAEVLQWVGAIAIAAVPAAFAGGLLRARLARSAVGGLVVELGAGSGVQDLEPALAHALRDPSVEIAYRLDDGTHVNERGARVGVEVTDGRLATPVVRSGREIALLVHDASLADDPALLDGVTAALGLALENGRLQAALRARVKEVEASRERVLEAGDEERRRLGRDLHDGMQQRLASVAAALGMARLEIRTDVAGADETLTRASAELATALDEMRELARGLHPAVLDDYGMRAAVADLSGRAPYRVQLDVTPERFDGKVEVAAYYVVAEAMANATKHAQASTVQIRVHNAGALLIIDVEDNGIGGANGSGSGLRGLADRVSAVEVSSRAGTGTSVHAEIPCA